MTIPLYDAASLRQQVGFAALIEPLRVAFGEYSHGRAQQVMAALWPGREPEDGNVLIKAGCIRTAATGALGRAVALAGRLAVSLPGVHISAVAAAEDAVRDSDVVITATAATSPLVTAGWLRTGQHVTAVGADDPGKCELEPGVSGRADLVVVDSRAAAAGNGSTRRALSAGVLASSSLTEIGELGSCRRDPGAITVACLVGIGVQDVVAAETALSLPRAVDL